MKEPNPIPQSHYSYDVHRRQFWLQIFLPIILMILIIIAVAVLTSISALGGNGDPSRWAAISTIWLVIPAMMFGLLLLALLAGLVYLLARSLDILPSYASLAQYQVNRVASSIKRFSDKATKPIIFLNSLGASMKAIFGRD
jgi:uncharacterized membrane protein